MARFASSSAPAPAAPLPVEVELNELRSLVAGLKGRDAEMLKSRIDALEARFAEQASSSKDPGEIARDQIIQALSTANAGKPGFLSMADIETRCNMTKSAVHNHVNELDKRGKVWIRKTHNTSNGRPCFYVYHPAAVRA